MQFLKLNYLRLICCYCILECIVLFVLYQANECKMPNNWSDLFSGTLLLFHTAPVIWILITVINGIVQSERTEIMFTSPDILNLFDNNEYSIHVINDTDLFSPFVILAMWGNIKGYPVQLYIDQPMQGSTTTNCDFYFLERGRKIKKTVYIAWGWTGPKENVTEKVMNFVHNLKSRNP